MLCSSTLSAGDARTSHSRQTLDILNTAELSELYQITLFILDLYRKEVVKYKTAEIHVITEITKINIQVIQVIRFKVQSITCPRPYSGRLDQSLSITEPPTPHARGGTSSCSGNGSAHCNRTRQRVRLWIRVHMALRTTGLRWPTNVWHFVWTNT